MKHQRIILTGLLMYLLSACQTAPMEPIAAPSVTSMPTETAAPTAEPIVEPTTAPTEKPVPTATALPPVVQLSIDPEVTYQTLDGFGANSYAFPYASDVGWDWEAVKFVFDEIDIAYIRLAPWMGWWETFNDNEDPYTINWKGFGTVNDIINYHDVLFAQYLHSQGIELSVGVWDFAGVSAWCDTCEDWLASGDPRTVPPELYPEVGESIAAYILNMQANGVPIAFAEVQNEPDIEAGIRYMSPEDLVAAGNVVLEMFDHYGLSDVPLHGPNLHSPRQNVPWIEAWLADENLRSRTAAVSYHTWWSEDPNNYTEIWEAAQKYDMPVWATEAGYSGDATGINPADWMTAYGYAESYYRAIDWSHASRVYHWALLGNDAAVGKDGERYPMFYVLKHFANYIPAGAVLIDSSADDDFFSTLAFALPDGCTTVIVLNGNRQYRRLDVGSLSGKVGELVNSSIDAYDVVLDVEGGMALLPPLSVTSFTLTP